jgi:uncharacterized cupredoxin-like copper-binding protein
MAATTTRDNGEGTQAVMDQPPTSTVEERLARIEGEVRRQGKTVRQAQRGWSIFAVFALLIAGANLIVVATKLDKQTGSTQARPNAPSAATKNAAIAAGAATTTSTPAAPAPAAAPGKVGVSLSEFKVTPTASQAPSGKVTFNVRNAGSVQHEFVVIKTNKPAAGLLKGNEADESGNVGETGEVNPGASKSLSLNLKPGHYALICNLPGHYVAGQHTDFNVK